MKKHTLGRLGALAIVLTCVSTTLLSGTLAKYTTTVSATDTATVAKFAFSAKDGKDTEFDTTAQTIDIFSNTNLGNAIGTEAGKKLIAPGAKGDFSIVLDSTGTQVAIDVVPAVTLANNGINLKFYIGDTAPTDASGYTIESTALKTNLETALKITLMPAETKTIKVFWIWADGKEADDTALGQATTMATAELDIQVTATQRQTAVVAP